MALFKRRRDLDSPTVRYSYGGDWGVAVENMDAAALYRSQPNLRAVVSFLADNAAQVPLKVHDRADQNDRPRVTDSTAALLLQQPNVDMTPFEFKRWMYSDLLLYERFLALVLPSAETDSGWELRPIPNAWIHSYIGSSPFAPQSVAISTPNNPPMEVPADKFILFHGYDPTDPMRQYSRISSLKETLHEQVESNKFRRQMWHRGGRFNAYLTRPKDVKPWTDGAFERFKETWKASWAGGEASEGGGMPILEDGMEIKTVQFNSRDAQWADSVKLSREDVAGVYHVNPALIWPGSGQTYASARDNARALYNDTLAPLLMQATDRINMALLPMVGEDPGHYVVYDITIKTQGTLEERISALQTACGGPFMSREEVRALIDLPREPDGELIVPMNVITGGLASNHDTDPTRERYNAAPAHVKSGGAEVVDAPKAPEPPSARKARGDPQEGDAEELEAVLRRFFERQAASVIPRIESGIDEWWNAERWNRELADDLYPIALAQADAAGDRAVKELWPSEPDRKYGKKQTAAYIRKTCEMRAEAINAATFKELQEAVDADEGKSGEVLSKGLKSTVRGVFQFASQHRAAMAGAALAAGLVGFALHEACKQNKRRGENVYKTWRTTSSTPRATHKAMNGETVQMDEAFSNGMMYPGDWSNGSAAECAHCKCVLDVEVRENAWERGKITSSSILARADLSEAEKSMLIMAAEDAENPFDLERSCKLADAMDACIEQRAAAYRSIKPEHRTKQHYDQTVNALIADIGDVYGMKLSGGFAEGASKVDPTKIVESAIPNGDELWAVTRMRGKFKKVEFPSIDRGIPHGNPDLLVDGAYIDIKTPTSKKRIGKNLTSAATQCRQRGQMDGIAILSPLNLSEEGLAEYETIARSWVRHGRLKTCHVIRPNGSVESI